MANCNLESSFTALYAFLLDVVQYTMTSIACDIEMMIYIDFITHYHTYFRKEL